jgi:hypothetical protein
VDPFVQQLQRLCTAHPTRSKWIFVPTHAIGCAIGDRLVLEGTDWANLRLVTPLDIALRMGAPFLVERGIDPSEEGLGPALMMRLLLSLPEENGYFRRLATQPQMAVALWSTLRELRMAGVRAADLRADAFESPHKHAELHAIVSAYETYLTSNRRGDVATVFKVAVDRHPHPLDTKCFKDSEVDDRETFGTDRSQNRRGDWNIDPAQAGQNSECRPLRSGLDREPQGILYVGV